MSEPKEPLLSRADRQGPVWSKLKKFLEDRLNKARQRNDVDLTEKQTARLRGRIDELKALLDLGEDKPSVPVDEFKD